MESSIAQLITNHRREREILTAQLDVLRGLCTTTKQRRALELLSVQIDLVMIGHGQWLDILASDLRNAGRIEVGTSDSK